MTSIPSGPGETWPRGSPRAAWPAIRRGFACRCPNCGEGRLFGCFLKVMPHCDRCGVELHHHRADDFPPYLTIFVVGHIVVPAMTIASTETDWPDWVHMAIWPALTLILSLLLIQPLKGAVVGFQWAKRMHGFGEEPSSRDGASRRAAR